MLLIIPEKSMEPEQLEALREFAIAIIDEENAEILKDRHFKCKIENRTLHFPLENDKEWQRRWKAPNSI